MELLEAGERLLQSEGYDSDGDDASATPEDCLVGTEATYFFRIRGKGPVICDVRRGLGNPKADGSTNKLRWGGAEGSTI